MVPAVVVATHTPGHQTQDKSVFGQQKLADSQQMFWHIEITVHQDQLAVALTPLAAAAAAPAQIQLDTEHLEQLRQAVHRKRAALVALDDLRISLARHCFMPAAAAVVLMDRHLATAHQCLRVHLAPVVPASEELVAQKIT